MIDSFDDRTCGEVAADERCDSIDGEAGVCGPNCGSCNVSECHPSAVSPVTHYCQDCATSLCLVK